MWTLDILISNSVFFFDFAAGRYAHQPDKKQYEFGFKRGNNYHNMERYEKAGPNHDFKTKVGVKTRPIDVKLLQQWFKRWIAFLLEAFKILDAAEYGSSSWEIIRSQDPLPRFL